MGLSEKYRQRIKESMDLDEGGRLHAIADKAASVDAPVLIIGLGGTGMDCLLKVKKLIYDTIQPEDLGGGRYSDKPKNIEYMGFDTDSSYANKAYQGMRLSKQSKEVNVMLMPEVQPVITHPEMLPPYINQWLDTSIPVTEVTAGAGAVRQLGRLLFMQNLGEIVDVLNEKIDKVTNGFDVKTPLYVFIVSGISGGTGSGTFLDMPYLIRALSEMKSPTRAVKNIGILFMPDANANRSSMTEVGKQSIYANGFAALKELDYLMNVEETGDSFSQTYGSVSVGKNTSGKAIPPYTLCLLMSSKDKYGAIQGSGDENYDNLTNVVAETIFNFVLGDDGVSSIDDFSIASWLSNETKNISIYKTMLGDLKHPVSYKYSIAGASSAQLPLDDIMSYLAYKAFQEVEGIWQQAPKEQDVEAVKSFFHLNKKTIEAEAQARVVPVNIGKFAPKILKASPQAAVQEFEVTFKKQQIQITDNLENMLQSLQQRVDGEDNIIRQYFLDLSKGPVFAQQCLYSTANEHSLITDLSKMILEFADGGYTADQIEALSNESANALTDFLKSLTDFTGGKLKKYLTAMQTLYNCKLKNFLYEQLQIFCNNAIGILKEENNEIFSVIADLMEQMMKIFEKYGRIKSTTKYTEHAGGTTLSWHIVETPKFVKEVEKRMEEKPDFSVNMQKIVQDFYVYLLENNEKWRGENYDVVEDINTFIFRQFDNVLDNTMEFFLEIIAQSEGRTLVEYCGQIIRDLISRAEVRYPIDASFDIQAIQSPKYSFVSVPSNCPTLLNVAKDIVPKKSIVKTSGIKDRIFMMNFESATPLSLNLDIKQFYTSYIMHRNSQCGLHLYMPTEFGSMDWKKLPSPLPESEWGSFEDKQEHQSNEEYREVFKKALEYGYIEEDVAGRSFVCRYGDVHSAEELLNDTGIKLNEESSVSADTARKARRILRDELSREERKKYSIARKDIISKDDGETLDRSFEEMYFIQMFTTRDRVKEMVKNHENILAALEQIASRSVDGSVVYTFVMCRLVGLIDKKQGELTAYVYMDRKGAAQPLRKVDGRMKKYQEYYLLDAFTKIPQDHKDHLAKTSEEKINDVENADRNAKALSIYKERMVEDILRDLKYDYLDLEKGDSILISYQMLLNACEQIDSILSGDADDDTNPF